MEENTITVEEAEKWIKALRSGKYKQSYGQLQDNKGFCCLGVACDVFIPDELLKRSNDGLISGVTPTEYNQPNVPKWLQLIMTDFKSKTKEDIWMLNDGIMGNVQTRYSFDEIADIIQAVYVEKVLD